MYILLLVIHVIVCFVLIAVVLLQAGRGGGFSEMMGGSQPSSIFGTQTSEFMTKATEVCAVIFIITSLSLGILSTQRGKSLMANRSFADSLKKVASAKTLPGNVKTDISKAADTVKTEVPKTVNVVNAAKDTVSQTAAPDAAKKL